MTNTQRRLCILAIALAVLALELLNHELAHCAGLRHDRMDRWQ